MTLFIFNLKKNFLQAEKLWLRRQYCYLIAERFRFLMMYGNGHQDYYQYLGNDGHTQKQHYTVTRNKMAARQRSQNRKLSQLLNGSTLGETFVSKLGKKENMPPDSPAVASRRYLAYCSITAPNLKTRKPWEVGKRAS